MPAIRDPVQDWIQCSKLEMQIVDSPLFQRLQWVSQLNSVKHVYPGGVHSRFLHSLGVMKLAGQYMTHLLETLDNIPDYNLVPELRTKFYNLARIAGLLHDIGHGPFSHAFDRAIYSQIYGVIDGGHDFHRFKMVKSPLLKPLLLECGIEPHELIAVWNSDTDEYRASSEINKNWYDIIRVVVQGPLGADRMDFTSRDSYFTGTLHLGTIASGRIIGNTRLLPIKEDEHGKIIDEDSNDKDEKGIIKLRIHYHIKCISDVIQAMSGRYYMYDSVYLHKTSSAANILIERMLKSSAHYLKIVEQTDDLSDFQWLNDSTMIGSILSYRGYDKGMIEAKKYCRMYLQRDLPKLEKELMVPVETPFKPSQYLQTWSKKLNIPKIRLEIVRTRTLSGIEPEKFDSHHIYFWQSSGERLTCQEALDSIEYTKPQKPYYLVRIYQMPLNQEKYIW